MKKCIYCSEYIDLQNDDFQKIGKKYVCVLCYDDFAGEFELDLESLERDNNLEE